MDAANEKTPRWIAGVEPSKEVLAMNGTQILEYECRQQPQKLRELLHAYESDTTIRQELHTLSAIVEKGSGPVLFIGMGGSLCSSVSGSVHLQSHGRSAFSIDAGEWLNYSQPVWNSAALSVLLTTSGESAELVELFRRKTGGPMALVCNNPASPCWQLADHKLPILAGPEYGNATKTYTNSTAATILLTSEILHRPWKNDAETAATALEEDLDLVFAMREELEVFCRGAANTEVIGRGAAYGAAFMGALTIREMSGHRAAPHTGAGFKHGPNLDTDATHVAIILAVGRTAALGYKLAAECNRKGGKVILVSNEDHPRTKTLLPIRLQSVSEPWEGITTLIVPQALTLARIERDGCRLPPRFAYGVMEQ